ncbi:glutamate--tRNA ligase [Luteitalea pratensis]|uniref:glutamate--tRNA ligase n=1 Tax=Luteitalea pratensis TaxID=1855912 RepID=UPI000D7324A5|nr:glutamate--tRNA ligase [Luteitalea pratensis]
MPEHTFPPRVRFAPSPTGYLHVGGARTALFNWLLARHTGGAFVLRIEDTDMERSSDEMVQGILDGMRWLGLTWDEGPGVGGPHGPYFQSQRLDRYRAVAAQLVASGHAYYDYRGADARATASETGDGGPSAFGPKQYDETSVSLSAEEVVEREAAGMPRAVRFRVPPEGRTVFADAVHGEIGFDNAGLEDFVILRSDGCPTYHLSVVVDDMDMQITQVIRGDDHISNTPKQVLLYEALGAPVPGFAHVPLILGPDKKRLSKRHGATSVMEYSAQGVVPEAMVNFLALLGWSPGTDQELFSADELVERFDLEGISGGNAVFNPEKLEWMNNQHIMQMSDDVLIAQARPWLEQAGLWRADFDGPGRPWLVRALALLRPRAKRLGDIPEGLGPLVRPVVFDPAAATKHLTPQMGAHLDALATTLADTAPFDPATIEQAVRGTAEARGVKPGVFMQAVRVSLTGRTVSPGLFETIELLGRDESLARIRAGARRAGPA